MKRKLYIIILITLSALVGALTACNKESAVQPKDTPADAPAPTTAVISDAPILFVLAEGKTAVYDSLYHQLAYLKMENQGYNVSSVYANGSNNIQNTFAQMESDGFQYVILADRMFDDQAANYIELTNSNMVFMHYDEYMSENILSYQIKLYEYYYLAGAALCNQSSSKTAGFVADSPDEQTIRCINAFALGMKAVDEQSVVIVSWTDPEEKEETAQLIQRLSDKQCDVFAYFTQNDYAEKAIANTTAYYMTMSTHTMLNTDDQLIIKPTINLDVYYAGIINTDKNALQYGFDYIGVGENIISYELSNSASDSAKDAAAAAYTKLQGGYEIFTGPIYSELGLIVPDGTVLPMEDILDMLWFVDNVVGQLPAG